MESHWFLIFSFACKDFGPSVFRRGGSCKCVGFHKSIPLFAVMANRERPGRDERAWFRILAWSFSSPCFLLRVLILSGFLVTVPMKNGLKLKLGVTISASIDQDIDC